MADVQTLLANEIKAQAQAAITMDTAEKDVRVEWERAQFQGVALHTLTVVYGGRGRESLSNETDLVTHRFDVEMTRKGESRATEGAALSLWADQVQKVIGDRASDRSPLMTAPLPLTSGDIAAQNAAVFGVQFGEVTTTSSQQQGAWRFGVTLPVEVKVQERVT